MSVKARDLAFGVTAMLAFPVVMNLTAITSSGDGRSLDDPLFQRGGEPPSTSARR